MLRALAGAAFKLDTWLEERIGRPYRVLLTVGLLADIVHRIAEAPEHIQARRLPIAMILAVIMEAALLIHQLAEMHHRLTRHAPAAAGSAKPPGPPGQAPAPGPPAP